MRCSGQIVPARALGYLLFSTSGKKTAPYLSARGLWTQHPHPLELSLQRLFGSHRSITTRCNRRYDSNQQRLLSP